MLVSVSNYELSPKHSGGVGKTAAALPSGGRRQTDKTNVLTIIAGVPRGENQVPG